VPRLDRDWLDRWPMLWRGTKIPQKGFDAACGAYLRGSRPTTSRLRSVILGSNAGAYHGVDQFAALRGLLCGWGRLQQRWFPAKPVNCRLVRPSPCSC